MLSNIILYPLTQIIEVVYLAVHKVFKTFPCPAGFAIIGVSVAITFLCLPLYVVAEKWQQIERDTQKKLKPGIDRIKAVFKGDEQYMILSTFYRQNHYHPMMALRSSFGLLIQIPFFMAAYSYLSNLEELKGLSFLFIRDLGNPDATFYIGSFPVNILPIAMTLINCVAGAIYTKGFGWKDKLQVYGMAALFLVILYNSPAGLVLYWTMNNIFSLVKNVFYKLKHPLWTLYGICCIFVLGADWFILFKHTGFLHRRLILIGILSIVFFIPLILKFINFFLKTFLRELVINEKNCFALFISSAILLCFLCGLFIPNSVISSSPQEFCFIEAVDSPFTYLRISFYKAIGFFIFWPVCVYFLFNNKVKAVISFLFSSLGIGALINTFIFHGDYGNLSRVMTLSNAGLLKASGTSNLINLLSLLISILVLIFIIAKNKHKYISYIFAFVSTGIILISFSGYTKIKKEYKTLSILNKSGELKATEVKPIFHLSKTNQNVFVVDFDRFLGAFVPDILEERPELKEKLDGFVFYPNTASFGGCTIIGSPSMFGGYDYTPEKFQSRTNDTMVSKHNEALTAVPRLFSENGFATTVTDFSFANYSWVADMSIFDQYPGITALRTENIYTDLWLKEHPEASGNAIVTTLIKRNLFLYSLMRIVPLAFRDTLYYDGKYWNTQNSVAELQAFIGNYAPVDFLPNFTDFSSDKDTYTFMVNDSTHEPAFLQYPDYTPTLKVTEYGNGKFSNLAQYHVTVSVLLKFADFIEYLKQNDCYDNTRIIITSDHGENIPTGNLPEPEDKEAYTTYEKINPVLLVKDFNKHGNLETDMQFMTNADTPALSVKDLIENPVNPFTGNLFDFSGKENNLYGIDVAGWSPDAQNKYSYKISKEFILNNTLFDSKSMISIHNKKETK